MNGYKVLAVVAILLVVGGVFIGAVGITLANGPWNRTSETRWGMVGESSTSVNAQETPFRWGEGMWSSVQNVWGTMMGGWNGMMGGGMMGGWGGPGNGTPLSDEEVQRIAQEYVASFGDANLAVAEIMAFDNQFYVQAREQDTGRYAFEFLIDRYTGTVTPEPGPNMMWNTKYGHMGGSGWGSMMGGGMMGSGWGSASGEMRISPEQAIQLAQAYLSQTRPGFQAAEEADAFYGYYTIHILEDGEVAGMLSVNGYTGEVWPHTWHGTYLGMVGGDDH